MRYNYTFNSGHRILSQAYLPSGSAMYIIMVSDICWIRVQITLNLLELRKLISKFTFADGQTFNLKNHIWVTIPS